MGQGLPVPVFAPAGGHRLHRPARALRIDPAPPSPIRPRERLEYHRREVLQITPDRSHLFTQHTRSATPPIKRARHHRPHMTKPYLEGPLGLGGR